MACRRVAHVLLDPKSHGVAIWTGVYRGLSITGWPSENEKKTKKENSNCTSVERKMTFDALSLCSQNFDQYFPEGKGAGEGNELKS